jgi:hypothetical protein
VVQSFYSNGRRIKAKDQEDVLPLEEVDEEVARLLEKYPRREKRRSLSSNKADAVASNTDDEIQRLLATYTREVRPSA